MQAVKWLPPEPGSIRLLSARYDGGKPGFGDRARKGELRIDTQAIAIFPFGEGNTIPISDVESVEVTDLPPAPQSKVPWVVLFGVLGLAAKGSSNQVGMTVNTRDGSAAYFTVAGMTAFQVRAQCTPLLRSLQVPLLG
jgi:hypothetical protein